MVIKKTTIIYYTTQPIILRWMYKNMKAYSTYKIRETYLYILNIKYNTSIYRNVKNKTWLFTMAEVYTKKKD